MRLLLFALPGLARHDPYQVAGRTARSASSRVPTVGFALSVDLRLFVPGIRLRSWPPALRP
jgi:hypothetical protein